MMVRILLSARLGEQRMTQTELARRTGIRFQTVNDWYNEITDSVKLEHLAEICRVLECDICDLLMLEDGNQKDHKSLPLRPKARSK